MTPRLKSSRRWTHFPDEYRQMISDLFIKEFKSHLGEAKLFIEGRIYPSEIIMRVGYLQSGRLVQNNFEASVEYDAQKEDVVKKIHACIDCLASLLHEHFTSRPEFPRTWHPIVFEKTQIYVQYNTENSDLEAEANRLLKAGQEPALVHEEEESEDLMEQDSASTPEETESDLDLLTPTLFSGKRTKQGIKH